MDTDILISGAGIAGMILAARLARQGRRVTICDPAPPPETAEAEGSDLRSTAYLQPSRDVLEAAGLWEHLAADATPLDALRVMNADGDPPRQRAVRLFTPTELGLDSFGWNVMNWRARKVLGEALAADPAVDLRFGVGLSALSTRDDAAFAELSDGDTVRAALVVGADGRGSPVRQAAGIDVRSTGYGQKALAFAMTHAEPHRNVSTEIYHDGGALVTVPTPDHEGRPASSVVWMNHGRRAAELAAMEPAAFDAALRARTLDVLGETHAITALRPWPVVTQVAERMIARRVALVAEAAHVLPPIGAQGLNTSIADIAVLADEIAGHDPGDPEALAGYARRRGPDIHARAMAIDGFNRVCRSSNPLIVGARSLGLKAAADIAPFRRQLMRAGLGG